jgi:LPPG:FO 2-phospho-L-lactate transferase
VKVAALSGGVGGARMLRGLAALEDVDLTAIVNIGDDEMIYGLAVSPDIDTVIYTLADREGPQGWGVADDSHAVMTSLERFPINTWFSMGDADLATNLFRTARLGQGWTLSQTTTAQAAVFGVKATVIPATDDPVRTEVRLADEEWISFQTYFVDRRHQGDVIDVRFLGAWASRPAPGVLEAIHQADLIVIGPSNPPLSIWPILAVPGVADAVGDAKRVVAVSPLFGGRPLKGPADVVMRGLGLPPGNAGVLAAYDGLLDELIIDTADVADIDDIDTEVQVRARDIRIADVDSATDLASALIDQ